MSELSYKPNNCGMMYEDLVLTAAFKLLAEMWP